MNPLRTPLLALLAATAAILLLPAGASAGTVTMDVGQSPAAVRDYWTKARMRHADPVPVPVEAAAEPAPAPGAGGASAAPPSYVPPASPEGGRGTARLLRGTASGSGSAARLAAPVADPSAVGVRAHGKVYFTVRGGQDPGNFVCSGTAVNSRNRSLVMTAGHCVFDSQYGGGKSINFAFAPAHGAGGDPYGLWPAKKLATTKQWKRFGNLRQDLGAVVVARNAGRRLQAVVGARGIGFDQPRRQHYDIFGYPAVGPFTGEDEYQCSSRNKGSDSPGGVGPKTIRSSCDMTAGSSGGGWVADGTLLSVTSYGYQGLPGYLYGPYLSKGAKKLYKRLRK